MFVRPWEIEAALGSFGCSVSKARRKPTVRVLQPGSALVSAQDHSFFGGLCVREEKDLVNHALCTAYLAVAIAPAGFCGDGCLGCSRCGMRSYSNHPSCS